MSVTYHNLLFGQQQEALAHFSSPPTAVADEPAAPLRYGDGSVSILDYGIRDQSGRKTVLLTSGARYTLFMCARFEKPASGLSCGFAIKDRKGTVLYGVTSLTQKVRIPPVREGDVLRVTTDVTMWLAAGDYFMTLGLADANSGEKSDFIEDAVHFTVMGPPGIFTTSVVNLETRFTMHVGEEATG
jgi:hypothetical protein